MKSYMKIAAFVIIIAYLLSMPLEAGAGRPAAFSDMKAGMGRPVVFSDVKDSDWFKPYIGEMSGKGICEGYGNGKYGPRDNLRIDQLIKMVVIAMGCNPKIDAGETYWAAPYIKQAKIIGLVKEGEYADYKHKITRGEIARMIARGMRAETFPSNLTACKTLIKDYGSIPAAYREYVLKVYCKGIVNGYADGRFGARDYATRAEASKMIVCYTGDTIIFDLTYSSLDDYSAGTDR